MSSGQLLCTRAAELGSAIACLQSATSSMRKNSRRLRTPDRVCLLQLVLGDVAEQLGLWKDPLLAGLPELGEAGKYLIELASTAGPTTAATGSGSSPNKTGAASPGAAGNGAPAAKAGGGEPLAGTLMGCLEEVSSVAAAAATAAAAVAEAAAPRHRPTPPAAAAGSDGHAAESDEESDDSEEDPLLVTLSDIYSVHRGVRGGTRNARMKAARIVPVQNRSFDLQGFEDFLQASGTCAADGSVPAAAAAAAAATATTGGLVDIPGSASGSRSSNRGAAAHDQGALYQQQLKLVQAQLTSCGMPAAGGAGMPMPADDAASEDGSFHSAEGAASPTPATPTGAAGAAAAAPSAAASMANPAMLALQQINPAMLQAAMAANMPGAWPGMAMPGMLPGMPLAGGDATAAAAMAALMPGAAGLLPAGMPDPQQQQMQQMNMVQLLSQLTAVLHTQQQMLLQQQQHPR